MMILLNRLITVLLVFSSVGLGAQDIHFSQFYMSPLNLNPAMTGVINGVQRVIVNYRNQWAGAIGPYAYKTYSVSYDHRLAVGQEDYFGLGGTLWSDVGGENNFGSTQARLSYSFIKKIAGRKKRAHYISFGADAGFTQRRITQVDFRWLTQVNANAEYCPSCGAIETIPNANITYPDLSGGLMWFSTLGDRKEIYAGLAMHHLNQANVSLLNQEANLLHRWTVHLGGEYPIDKKISVKPNVIYMSQGPHSELNSGASVRIKLKSKKPSIKTDFGQFLEIGAWYRVAGKIEGGVLSDAIILATRLDYAEYGIGFSYDYNVSSISQASPGNGSFELSLSYLFGDSGSVFCPVF